MAKILRLSLEKSYGVLRSKSTGKDASTAEFLRDLDRFRSKSRKIEQIAKECGLEKLYVILFRFSSLAVHGNTYELYKSFGDSARTALPAIVAFLRAVMVVADNYPHRATTAGEIEATLWGRPRKPAGPREDGAH